MKKPIIVDGRNIYEPDMMQELGFIYRGVGRGSTIDNNGNGHQETYQNGVEISTKLSQAW